MEQKGVLGYGVVVVMFVVSIYYIFAMKIKSKKVTHHHNHKITPSINDSRNCVCS